MTIYRTAEPTESFGGRLGTALGTGISTGLKELAKTKLDQQKANVERQKTRGALPSLTHKRLGETGRKEYDFEARDDINRLATSYFDQGFSNHEAVSKAIQDYETGNYSFPDDTPLDMLKRERNKQTEKGIFAKGLETILGGMRESAISPYAEAIPRGKKALAAIEKGFKKAFLPQDILETEEGRKLHKSATEKTKTAKSLDEFTQGELMVLKPEDVKNLPKNVQDQFWEIAPSLAQRGQSISQVAGVPFVGGAVEERLREAFEPGLPAPPPIATGARIAGELPLIPSALFEGALLPRIAKGAAFFGGEAAAQEAIRTLGTDKPADLKLAGIQALIGGLFPVGEKAIKALARPFRKALAREMKATGTTAETATENLLKRAEEKGVSFKGLGKGEEKAATQFTKFLDEEGAITAKKVKEVPVPKIEKPKAAEKRFTREARAISKTPLEEYTKPPKVKKTGYTERTATLRPQIQKNESRIKELQKDLRRQTGEELQRTRTELSNLKEKNRELSYKIKYDKLPPTAEAIGRQVEESMDRLVKDVMSGTPEATKRFERVNKTMETFLQRAKDELVRGKIPDKFAEGTFLDINRAYLKGYKDLEKFVRKEMAIPYSNMKSSQAGPEILHQLEKRIKGTEAALKVQEQKRKTLKALKGPTGKFYRKEVDKLLDQQKLFSKDMIRIGDKISEAERKITPVARKRIEESGAQAFKKGQKSFEKAAQKVGFIKTDAQEMWKGIGEIKSPSRNFKNFDEYKKWLRSNMKKILLQAKNHAMLGFVFGGLEEAFTEITGKKIPYTIKTALYVSMGAPTPRSRTRPILAISTYLSRKLWGAAREKIYKEKLKGKRGKEYLQELKRLKEKKGFTTKEIKEMKKRS